MSLDQENFEKLESYVDGTLDAEGKAQMQKLLADNPQLQQMMTELIAQRQLLRNLPRADAPEDLLESFQGQLEREALLGEPTSQLETPARRVERWPHLVLAAAIVFLVLGLAGLIYEVLPRHRETIPLVFAPGTGVNVGSDADQIEPTTAPSAPTLGVSSRNITGFDSLDAGKFPSTQSDDKKPAPSIAGEDFGPDREKLGTIAATSPSDEPVVIVVRSGYPVQAAVQVTQFLSSNNIAFESSSAAGLENRQTSQQTIEATTAPIALGNIKSALRQQLANSNSLKALPVTQPSEAAATKSENGFSIQAQNGLAYRNGALPGQEAASGQITYRAMLTEQQLQRLNAQLLNQPNQWTEVNGEANGHILSDALPPNAMQNAVVIAKSRQFDKSDATTRYSINGAAAPTTAPAPNTTEPSFTFAAPEGGATSRPIAVGGGFGGGAAGNLFPTTQPTTQAATAPSRMRECLIIVNAQPVNFPAPAAEPATLPATAPTSQSSPASQP
jgi:hypothetical protein